MIYPTSSVGVKYRYIEISQAGKHIAATTVGYLHDESGTHTDYPLKFHRKFHGNMLGNFHCGNTEKRQKGSSRALKTLRMRLNKISWKKMPAVLHTEGS